MTERRFRLLGYATGDYMCNCLSCGDQFIGDKRAITCLPCAGEQAASKLELETIVAAAIRVPVADKWRSKMWNGARMYPDHLVITAPPPARHHTLMHTMLEGPRSSAFEDQGFITSTGRYVEREEALQIVLTSGQPMIDHPSRHDRWLFSEDLW